MNMLVMDKETKSKCVGECEDGEAKEFTVKGTVHHMPDGSASVCCNEVSARGGKKEKTEEGAEEKPKKMSAAAAAVVGRKAK